MELLPSCPRLDPKIANERVALAIDFDCELEEGKW